MKRSLGRTLAAVAVIIALAAVAVTLLWAALAPIPPGPREYVFEIPAGTYQRRAAGNMVDILPPQIRLTVGVKDILLLRNLDQVPQIFGSFLIMPGQSFRLPFERAAQYEFECAAHSSGTMTIVVDPQPSAGWRRLVWRWRSALDHAAR